GREVPDRIVADFRAAAARSRDAGLRWFRLDRRCGAGRLPAGATRVADRSGARSERRLAPQHVRHVSTSAGAYHWCALSLVRMLSSVLIALLVSRPTGSAVSASSALSSIRRFEQNAGQWPADVRFVARTPRGLLELGDSHARLTLGTSSVT